MLQKEEEAEKTPVVACHVLLCTLLLHNTIIRGALDTTSSHARSHITLESFPVACQIVGSLLVERVAGVGLEEQELQADNDGIQIQHGLPVFAQNVQAHVALEVNVGVIDLLRALDLWRLVRKVLADVEGEVEGAVLVHALVG
jgi:hypothetical protein